MTEHDNIYKLLLKLDRQQPISSKDADLLSNCKMLDWSYRKYEYIPRNISCLKNLQFLDLSGLNLHALPDELCQLPELTELLLRENQLTQLPLQFGKLEKLTYLDLSENPWPQLPEQIRKLTSLTYLNLSNCKFGDMPAWLLKLNMDFQFQNSGRGIILMNTQSKNPDISIFQQKREAIVKYFNRLEEGGEIVRETKVIFLGDGNVGKTYTIDRIKAGGRILPETHSTDQTKGISIVHKDFEHNGNPVSIHFWDFGGQQIMHSMHRCFLTNNTIYVIVLSGRAEDMERRLTYWMTSLNSFTQGTCPVIVLENCFDVKNINSVNTTQARRHYKNIKQVLSINVKNAQKDEFDTLKETILDLATTESLYGKKIAKLWADTKTKIETLTEPYITEAEYAKYFPADIHEEERCDILEWLTDLGVSFCYPRDRTHSILPGYVVLNPEWATNAIYAIINNQRFQNSDDQQVRLNGILSLQQIQDILRETEFVNHEVSISRAYGFTEIEYILQVMRRFHIAYEVSHNDRIHSQKEEFIPALCKKSEPTDIEQDMQHADLHFEIRYEYLPSNILHRLMTLRYSELERGRKWWYSGGIFDSEEYRCRALILQETKDGKDVISIYIHQNMEGEAWRYLLKIRNQIEESNRQLNIRSAENFIIYSEENQSISEAIKLDDIRKYHELGWKYHQSLVFGKLIPLSDILKNITSPGMAKVIAKDGRELHDVIISGCCCMQKRRWLLRDEDIRNDYLCDILRSAQIYVLDQTRCGMGKKGSGEIDFLVQDNNYRDVAIIEALNLDSIKKDYLQEHITKLMSDTRYNVSGLRELYLLVYADVSNFPRFCERYEDFIKDHAQYPEHLNKIKKADQKFNNIAVWKANHSNDVVVHHICVKFSPQKTE